MTTWRALVLGGGGATGEFQMGVLPVLARVIPKFDFFAGVGVGSLHATVLAQEPYSFPAGVDSLIDLWKTIKGQRDILDLPGEGATLSTLAALGGMKDGVYGNAMLMKLIRERVVWDRLEPFCNWAIESTSLSDGLTYYITNDAALSAFLNGPPRPIRPVYGTVNRADSHYIGNLVAPFIAAAGSVPLMFPPIEILGHHFVEGGLRHFVPLELAVDAFRIALTRTPSLTPEFYVVDNYPREIMPETSDLLRGGQPIVMRSIKIMTVEMAQNDIAKGLAKLEAMNVTPVVHRMNPRVDYRLMPLDFDNSELRERMRDEGAAVASLLVGG